MGRGLYYKQWGAFCPPYCGNSAKLPKPRPSYRGNTPVKLTQLDPDQVGGSGITAKVPAVKSAMCLIKISYIAGCPWRSNLAAVLLVLLVPKKTWLVRNGTEKILTIICVMQWIYEVIGYLWFEPVISISIGLLLWNDTGAQVIILILGYYCWKLHQVNWSFTWRIRVK